MDNKDILIVSFSGHALKFGEVPVYEFYNFLTKHYPQYDKQFYIDSRLKHYHYGIKDTTTSVETTVEYLKDKIKDYKKVVFMGVSSGGYAAILFGSLLNITMVIAFIPQTILKGPNLNDKYRDLKLHINTTTTYNVYGDPNIKNPSDCHHISHCENISEFPNVVIQKVPDCTEMSKIKRSGQLFDIIFEALKDIK
jgi:hypothetical protein